MNPAEFLEVLWTGRPPGLIQLWTLKDRKSHYLRSPLGAGVVASHGRPDVYTGVALAHKDHGARRRARGEQAIAIAGLWLDIDVNGGPENKTGAAPDRDAAIALAGRIIEPTLLVDSGYGIHAWWLFEQPWQFHSAAERDAAATASKQWFVLHDRLAREHGWHVDHLYDLARLLRIPGTVNGKDPENPRTVRLLHDSEVRYPRGLLLEHAAAAGTVDTSAVAARGVAGAIAARPNAQLEQAVLDAIELNSPEFHATLTHQRPGTEHWSMSEWDLSIASQAFAAGWEDQRIVDTIGWHRRQWHGRRVGSVVCDGAKGMRVDYLRRTLARAKARVRREDAKADNRRLIQEAA